MKIDVVGLTGCIKCKELRSILDNTNIIYTFIDCDANSETAGLCDWLERITDQFTYPMVIVEYSDKKELLYISDIKNNPHKKDKYHLIQFYSLHSLLDYITKQI